MQSSLLRKHEVCESGSVPFIAARQVRLAFAAQPRMFFGARIWNGTAVRGCEVSLIGQSFGSLGHDVSEREEEGDEVGLFCQTSLALTFL